jgi:hypothetical protein
VGDGARVLDAVLMKLPELSVRRKLRGTRDDGDGDSKGMMDTRPAMSDTRCREERLRGRGDDGERDGGGRTDPDGEGIEMCFSEEVLDSGEGMTKESAMGVAIALRVEKDVEEKECIIGDELTSAWFCLGVKVASKAFDAYPNSGRGEYRDTDSSCVGMSSSPASFQSKPRPMDVTPQLPTLAAL